MAALASSARLHRKFDWGNLQVSEVLPVFSSENQQGDLLVRIGWGVAASAVVKTWADSKWYLMGVGGRGITSFITNLGATGSDLLIDPDGHAVSPFTFGCYITYEHPSSEEIRSSLSCGLVQVEKLSFTPDDEFYRGFTIRLNTLWDFVEGAKLGGEVIWGDREDRDGTRGDAFRLNLLSYYDF
jgi:hypothetical protein